MPSKGIFCGASLSLEEEEGFWTTLKEIEEYDELGVVGD